MKDPSSSSTDREARRKSDKSQPYSDRSSSKGGSSSSGSKSKSKSHHKSSSKRTEDIEESTTASSSNEKSAETPWLKLLPKDKTYTGVENRVHHEIMAYLAYMEQTPKERKAREIVMAGVRRVIHGRFSNAEVHVFGSSATGLGLPTSDIDVAITLPHNPDVKQALFKLSSKFKSSGLATNVFVNHRAHVPIIMVTTREEYGSISIDIGMNNPAGTEGVELMKGYLAQMPALRPLILVMKGFLRHRKLNDASKGGMGSYALACLCIHFLKVNPSKRPQEYIDKPFESESLGFLMTDFMFYYGFGFPYATSYVSTAEGKLLPKEEKSESLSVRCLINPEKDISKSVQKVDAFLEVFKEAYATILRLNLTDETMLGQLVGVSKKFMAHRLLISNIEGADRLSSSYHTPYNPYNTVYNNTQKYINHNINHTPHALPPRPFTGNTPRAPRMFQANPGLNCPPGLPMGSKL
ncbi:hypothetical protein DXG03_005488 [Asterophora parasitica]|uniref:polynucleotide adenylyltransferase n=1 Tax=Asterophora parasitica TaxID=117018 RepID=A0A9P7G1N1_9AGAR|nr:hypothetical protein DXG03_005488 [Asterophora parasitica]